LHIFKTFHLNLNEHGNVVVHEQIYELFKSEGILEELNATQETTPAPTFLHMGAINAQTGSTLAATVFSREEGAIAVPGFRVVNEIEPPSGMFRREPDGTWTDLQKVHS
jgi:hypothetical protein